MWRLQGIFPSTRQAKKLMAVFINKKTDKTKTVHFGSSLHKDYTIYAKEDISLANRRKMAYILRHSIRENWEDPFAAGTLSRYVLWNKPTMKASIKDYKKMFAL
jgi:hypothetical protein